MRDTLCGRSVIGVPLFFARENKKEKGNMKRKLLTMSLAAVFALGACFGLAACGGKGDEDGHEHEYTAENKCSVCGKEWEHTPFDAFEFTPVTLDGTEGYDACFGEYEYRDFTTDPQTGLPVVGEVQTHGKPFEGEEVVFPYGYNGLPVISIGRAYTCTSETVKTITVPKSILSWGIVGRSEGDDGRGAFHCEALETLNLPDGLLLETTKMVDRSSPDAISYLTPKAIFNNGMFGYGDCPLWDDPGHRVNGALYIGNYLFDTDFEETVETFTVRDGTKAIIRCGGADKVIVPDSVEVIAAEAFGSSLKSITLGKGLKIIGNIAFNRCYLLTDITIPEGVTEIGYGAFMQCDALTSVTIPSSVTKIGEMAFFSCTNIKEVHISDLAAWCGIDFSYTSYYQGTQGNPLIWGNAELFLNGTKVTELTIPSGVTEIKPGAFWSTKSITNIVVPDGATTIGSGAFYFCKNVTSVTIPGSVTEIGERALFGCGLTDIQFKGTVEAWQNINKGNMWVDNSNDYTITCTNGTIDKEGNVTYFNN